MGLQGRNADNRESPQVSQVQKMLGDEYGTASNIKSRVNRLSVLSAITSAQQRLKLYNKVRHQQQAAPGLVVNRWTRAHAAPPAPMLLQLPGNGLVVYTGTILTDDGKEKKVNIDFEPFKPINTSLYMCDNKFHTEALSELLESDNK
jgi:peptide chain release factor subunit 1